MVCSVVTKRYGIFISQERGLYMNESEKSRLYFNMHNMNSTFVQEYIYISLSQKKNFEK